MKADAFEAISKQAVLAEDPKNLKIADPCRETFVIAGRLVTVEVPVPPRRHHAGSLADVIALALRFKDDNNPVVWYDESRVVLVIDDDGHRVDMAALALTVSDVFARLTALRRKPEWLDQKAFVRLLKVDLAGTIPPAQLLDKARKVEFSDTVKAGGEVRQQRQSLSSSISSEIDVVLPDYVTLIAPVYSTPGERQAYPIECAVEIDKLGQKFQLIPLPDQIERVQSLAVQSIGERLIGALTGTPDADEAPVVVPCYFGKP